MCTNGVLNPHPGTRCLCWSLVLGAGRRDREGDRHGDGTGRPCRGEEGSRVLRVQTEGRRSPSSLPLPPPLLLPPLLPPSSLSPPSAPLSLSCIRPLSINHVKCVRLFAVSASKLCSFLLHTDGSTRTRETWAPVHLRTRASSPEPSGNYFDGSGCSGMRLGCVRSKTQPSWTHNTQATLCRCHSRPRTNGADVFPPLTVHVGTGCARVSPAGTERGAGSAGGPWRSVSHAATRWQCDPRKCFRNTFLVPWGFSFPLSLRIGPHVCPPRCLCGTSRLEGESAHSEVT